MLCDIQAGAWNTQKVDPGDAAALRQRAPYRREGPS
jgi:hypothetical protein